MRLQRNVTIIALLSLVVFSSIAEQRTEGKTEVFAPLNGRVGAGIISDGHGNMFVGKDGALLKITPEGKTAEFCSLADLPKGKDYSFPSPLIWDMAFDGNGNIIAASQDRILRIAPDGAVTTLIREDFDGLIGASGVALDKSGCMYVTSGNKILKYTPRMEKTVFIDASKNKIKMNWQGQEFDIEMKSFIFLAFDPGYRNLYVSEFFSASLLKYPIRADGTPGDPVILFNLYTDDLSQAPLNVVFGDRGSLYVSYDMSSKLLKIDRNGKKGIVPMEGKIRNHIIAFGGKGFDEECIYFTTYSGDFVYKIFVGEKSAASPPK